MKNNIFKLLSDAIKGTKLTNVSVRSSSGFTISFAKCERADYMVRGVRDIKDFESEMKLFNINKKLEPSINKS